MKTYQELKNLKVALVHDYLIRFGGAERVLRALHEMFPGAPIYTLLYDEKKMKQFFPDADIRTSFLQKSPGFIRRKHRFFLPMFPAAAEAFDLSEFDLVISSSNSFVKGIITKPKTIHICYCQSPTRFLWDWHYKYPGDPLKDPGLEIPRKIFKVAPIKILLHFLRLWDRQATDRVDYFLAISKTVQGRIWKYYKRESVVIYPPANLANFCKSSLNFTNRQISQVHEISGKLLKVSEPYFLIVSQLVSHKRINLAIEAFNKLGLPLLVIGEGRERKGLEKIAAKNIKFLGWLPDEAIKEYYQNCTAFIFPGEEDFGIAPIEAMSYGKPVVAYRKGGVTESVIEGMTGEFFDDPHPAVLADGVRRLMENVNSYSSILIRKRAEKFSRERFEKEFFSFLGSIIARK